MSEHCAADGGGRGGPLMDNKYHGIACSLLPQPGQRWSARAETAYVNVPAEYQGPLLVVGAALLNGHKCVLARLPWDEDVPMGVWFRQDWFMENFRREDF